MIQKDKKGGVSPLAPPVLRISDRASVPASTAGSSATPLGVLPAGWRFLPIDLVTNNHDSKRRPVKGSERKSGPYPYYGASGIVDWVDDYIFDGEYLLVAEDGENLKTTQTPIAFLSMGKSWVNNHAHIITGNEKALTKYLLYALQNMDIKPYLTGAVMPKLTQANLNSIQILLPPLLQQQKIAAILSALDDKIALNRATNQTLEQIAQALFKSWFVDFDPVHAKARGEQPVGMDAATAALFPDSFEESELGMIPKGWEVKKLSELIQITGGGTPKRSEESYWNGNIPWYSVKDAPNESDVFVIDTDEHISEIGLKESSTRLLSVGTTIISARGTVGKLALVATPMCMNQSCYGILGNNGSSNCYNYFNLKFALSMLQEKVHGAVFDTITTATFETCFVVFPGIKYTAQYESAIQSAMKQIETNVRQNTVLNNIRDSLLPKLLSGEISVADVAYQGSKK